MKITVIGAGNSGLIHAAKLITLGNEVCILKSSSRGHSGFFDKILAEGSYKVSENLPSSPYREYPVKPAFITKDPRRAITFADIIFVTTTVSAHEAVAQLIAPYVRDGQTIVLAPSYMSRFVFMQHIQADVTYGEWETTAYNGRIVNNDHVRISFYNPRNAMSVYPQQRRQSCLNRISECFSNTAYFRENSLETALHNPNMIVHTIGVVLSAARIEYSAGEFWMYREAFTPSVINVIEAFDREKNEILKAVGCTPLSYFEAAKWRNEEDLSLDAMEVFKSFANSSNKGPSQLNTRYLTEDVPMGLALFSSLGRSLKCPTTIADSIIELSSALLNTDFRKTGRTVDKLLGKDKISQKDLLQVLN